MEITCWNCKKPFSLDQKAIDAALAAMDVSKLGFFDVPCPNCGKANRTKREQFVAPAAEPKMRAFEAKKAKEKEQRDLGKKKGYKGK